MPPTPTTVTPAPLDDPTEESSLQEKLTPWLANYLIDLVITHFNQRQFFHMLRACWEQSKDQKLVQLLVDTLLEASDKRSKSMILITAKQMRLYVEIKGVEDVKLPLRGTTVEALQDKEEGEGTVRDYICDSSPEACDKDLEEVLRWPGNVFVGEKMIHGWVSHPENHATKLKKPPEPAVLIMENHQVFQSEDVVGSPPSSAEDGYPGMMVVPASKTMGPC